MTPQQLALLRAAAETGKPFHAITVLALLDHIDQVRSENVTLRQILSECAAEINAAVGPQCSIEFMAGIPEEARLRIARVRASTIEECAKVASNPAHGVSAVRARENIVAAIRALALPAAPNEEKPT